MQKATKTTLILILMLGMIAGGFWLYTSNKFSGLVNRFKGNKQTGDSAGEGDVYNRPTGLIVNTGSGNAKFPLSKGSKGDEVKVLQEWINLSFWIKDQNNKRFIGVDGNWGSQTENALKELGFRTTITEEEFYQRIKYNVDNMKEQFNLNTVA